MTENLTPVDLQNVLERRFDLETTAERMADIISSGNPWRIEVTRYKDEKDKDGNLQLETVVLTDVDFAKGEVKVIDASTNITGLDLMVSKNSDEEEWKEDDKTVFRKHISSGIGHALIGPALDDKWFDRELKSKESRVHIDKWCEEKGIPMKGRLKAEIAMDVAAARNREMGSFLKSISDESQSYIDNFPMSKFTRRIRQYLEAIPA